MRYLGNPFNVQSLLTCLQTFVDVPWVHKLSPQIHDCTADINTSPLRVRVFIPTYKFSMFTTNMVSKCNLTNISHQFHSHHHPYSLTNIPYYRHILLLVHRLYMNRSNHCLLYMNNR